MDTTNTGKKGPVIGAVIIIVLLVIAGLYVWGSHLNKTASENQTETEAPVTESSDSMMAATSTASMNAAPAKMSSADDVDSLSNDLDSDASANSSGNTSF
jgi:hypothetical protein